MPICLKNEIVMAQGELDLYLKSAEFIDSDHPDVQGFVRKQTVHLSSIEEKIEALYFAVRDGFRYDPYRLDFSKESMKASNLLSRNYGYCVEKSCLFAAAARAIGVPARMGFANVRNHIGTARLEEVLQTNVLVFHGYAEIFLNNKWIKITPVFNKELCNLLNVAPLGFSAEEDAIFQQYDQKGGQFMEYLHDYGHFPDIPYDLFMSELVKFYPHMKEKILEGKLVHLK